MQNSPFLKVLTFFILLKILQMEDTNEFEIIIIGGSYAGLAAGLTLGRSLRKVLIIDSGKPCNRQTPYSHNLLTRDGQTPQEISTIARKQVEKYNTVKFYDGLVTDGIKTIQGFEITTQTNDTFKAKKIVFATGIKDKLPNIKGFAECWGISIIHCPYCHGYEVRNEKTGILGNGDYGFEFSKMINHLTNDLTLFTDGKSTLTKNQMEKLESHDIKIIETEIDRFEHNNGNLDHIVFKDGSKMPIKALYAKVPFVQHSDIPKKLGCELTEEGYLKVDMFQETTIKGLFACGDNTSFMRSLSNAISNGSVAGAVINKELVIEEF